MLQYVFVMYHPLNEITLSSKNLISNYKYLTSLNIKIKVAPVLKSNAYGHGIINVAKTLEVFNPPFFCVDSLYEGYQLLNAGIKIPILIMGYINPKNLSVKKLPFSYAVYNFGMLGAILKYQPKSGIHIFVDTGMHREGVRVDDLADFVNKVKSLNEVNIEGLMSHFASPDDTNNQLTKDQVSNFQEAQDIVKKFGLIPKWIHMGASSGLLHHKSYKNIGNLARTGKALYGLNSLGNDPQLKPVLELSTTLAQIKILKKGESVGYDFTFKAKKDLAIGILPIGYNDGVDRRLSNRGFVLIDNTYCPIIGRISMNITTIDLSNVKNPFIGQKVIVFSANQSSKNSVINTAKICQTIPHDLLVHLSESIRREII